MTKISSKFLLFVVAVMAVVVASHAVGAQTKQQAHANDYFLDNSVGDFALYPGPGWRSYVEPKYDVPSLEELERRVSQLPPGAKLTWVPYKRDKSGEPILFSEGQYDRFARFCRDHKIELIVWPSQPSKSKTD